MKHLAPEGKQNLAMAIAMLIVSVISVALRFTVRITAGLPLIVADWLIMPALIAMLIYLGVLIECKQEPPSLQINLALLMSAQI